MALKTKDIKKTAQKVTKIAIKKAKSAADDVVEKAGDVRDAVAKQPPRASRWRRRPHARPRKTR